MLWLLNFVRDDFIVLISTDIYKEEKKKKASEAGVKLLATSYLTLSYKIPQFISCYFGDGWKKTALEITFMLLGQELSFLSVTEISITPFQAKN